MSFSLSKSIVHAVQFSHMTPLNPTRAWGLPRENDIQLDILPFETSKSLRLTVIGERLQSKVEDLGPALECCAQSMEDYLGLGLSKLCKHLFSFCSLSFSFPAS